MAYCIRLPSSGDEFAPRGSGTDGVSTGMETDGKLMRRHAVVTGRLVLQAAPQHDVSEADRSRVRCRELLEQAFDVGKEYVFD